MLFCQLIWVFASFMPYDKRKFADSSSIWEYYFARSWVRILITAVLSPLENWVLHEYPLFLFLAPLLHAVCTPIVYIIRVGTVIKSSLFSSTQGMFYDTFMYSGSYEDFKSFQSVVFTEQFRYAYLFSFFVFGNFFYYFAVRHITVAGVKKKRAYSSKNLLSKIFFIEYVLVLPISWLAFLVFFQSPDQF